MNFTDEQKSEMARLKSHFPYRIVWAEIDAKTGIFGAFASFDKRAANKSAKAGNVVAILQ